MTAKLLSLGHQVRSVRNVVSRNTKEPLSMFFVDLDPQANNKEVYDINNIENAIITVEAPKTFDDIVQCFRCQQFGHTKSYCKKPFCCVKCGLGHATAECRKTINTPPQCVHCLKNHTANYKGCEIYRNLIARRSYKMNSHSSNDQGNHNFNMNRNQFPHLNTNSLVNNFQSTDFNKPSYAQAAKGIDNGVNNVLQKLETMVAKQIELTNTLINMMSMLMSKICK